MRRPDGDEAADAAGESDAMRFGALLCRSRASEVFDRLAACAWLASRLPSRADATLVSDWNDGVVELPAALPPPVPVGDRVSAWHCAPDVILATAGASRAAVDSSGSVRLQLEASDPDENALVDAVLFELLGRAGYLMVHASVIELDGRGCMICGQSGAGKSTFAHQSSMAGAAVVTDDVALLDVQADRVTAVGTIQTLRIRPESAAGLAAGDDKAAVVPARVHEPGSIPVDLIVLLRGSHPPRSETTWHRDDALAAMLPHVALALDVEAADQQLALLEAVTALPIAGVATGRDLLEEPARASHLVRSLLADC